MLPFKLFAHCIPVYGANRSIICDLQRKSFEFIPNILFEIITKHEGKTINQIEDLYGIENSDSIREYFNFLIEKEFIFFCDEEEMTLFPKLNLEWSSPVKITNAIIDFNKSTDTIQYMGKIANELNVLGCTVLELRFYDDIQIEKLAEVLDYFSNHRVRMINLLIKYNPKLLSSIGDFCFKYQRVNFVYFHSAPEEKSELLKTSYTYVTLFEKILAGHECCGAISPIHFRSNVQNFTENLQFNSCLNRKVGIDVEGNIKNCPSSRVSFGNIKNSSLIEVIGNETFKSYWGINKDQIKVCKDCEFRYICSDCRIYIENENDLYSKPAKCNYDPYTSEWKEVTTI
jgi:SPASM domain peptide maturase of grasp-with-spasm system